MKTPTPGAWEATFTQLHQQSHTNKAAAGTSDGDGAELFLAWDTHLGVSPTPWRPR